MSTLEAIGNKLGKFVKASDATLKGKYTSFARICIEMDVSGALPEAICHEFRDEEWIQSIDYEYIPFRCRRCHEHGHLLRECSLIRKTEQEKKKQNQDEEVFVRPNYKGKGNQRQSKPPANSNPETKNSFEGLGNQTQVREMGQDRQGEREKEEKETNKTMEQQNLQETVDNDKVSTGEGTRDPNTPLHEGDGDSEMTPSEVGTEDPDLRDIIEREGIDLQNILEQWKKQGMDNIPSEQLDRIQYLFLMREEEKARGIKRMHGEIGTLDIKAGDNQQQHSPKQAKRKKGMKSNNIIAFVSHEN
jgi:hypothetical protein